MENFGYLLAAFIVVWAGFFGYLFSLARRQRRLEKEIEALRGTVRRRGDKSRD